MSYCPNCGAKVQDNMKFCVECGTRLSAPAAPVQQTYEAPSEPVQQTYETPAQTYEAPAQTYEAPAQTYETPAQTYEAPAQTYEAPAQTYEAPAQTYEAPAQTYETPAQQTYELPVQQKYEIPVQNSAGGSYTPPPAPPKAEKPAKAPKAPKSPKSKKSGGKLLIPIIAGVVVLAALVVGLLFAFGGKNQGEEADWGRYDGVSCMVAGMDLGADGEWVELQKKGKATLGIMGDEYSAKWTLDGEDIVIKQGGDEFAGTLKNGVLEVDMAGMVYTFKKEGAAAVPQGNQGGTTLKPTDKEPDAPENADGAVTYKLVSASADGEEIPADILEMMGGGYIVFNGDGTGTFALFGENNPINYDGTHMMAGDEKIAYTLTDNGMEFAMDDGSAFVLEITDETPNLSAPTSGGEMPEEPEEGGPVGIESWSGDYYGYWVIDSVWETNEDWVEENAYWDCCASVDINADGTGTMTIWDEDFTKDEPLAELDITVSENSGVARFCSEEGYFMSSPIEHADWLWYTDGSEYDSMFVIDGQYEDGTEDFWYIINLRPWGYDWSDVEENDDLIPYYYYDWYLPMVEDGQTEAPAGNVGQ